MHGETVRFRQHSIFIDEVKNLRVFGENTALSYAFSLKKRNKTVRFRRQRNYANLREFEMFWRNFRGRCVSALSMLD
jgi:hypothetical protein